MPTCIACSSAPDGAAADRTGVLVRALQRCWYRPSPPWPLRALAALFALGVRWRRLAYARGLYASVRLAPAVIVVGNLTVGGAGKTPLVVWLTERLRERGVRAGIVLRGYGGRIERARTPLLVDRDSSAALVGDEALLLRERTLAPVAVGRDRVRAAQLLLDSRIDVIISDDGLQHLRLARAVEIVVIDGERGLGNGHLLPAGPLREPGSRLAGVDAIVVNGSGVGAATATAATAASDRPVLQMQLLGERLQPLAGGEGSVPLSTLAGRRVHAVAGIGRPQRFFEQLRAAGLELQAHAFPDHYQYCAADLEFGDGLPVLMTEKDAVKCRAFAASGRWYLPVAASLSEAHAAQLLGVLATRLPALPWRHADSAA
jgi:tetraacyldisaccharide 4'-kinase